MPSSKKKKSINLLIISKILNKWQDILDQKPRIARKFGEPIFGADKSFEKKNYPPGQHGAIKEDEKLLNMAFS